MLRTLLLAGAVIACAMFGHVATSSANSPGGRAASRICTIPTGIALSHGDETPSLPYPDMYIKDHVVPNGPDDKLISAG